jgi:hypothetical protein
MVGAEEVSHAAVGLPGRGAEARREATNFRIVGGENVREDCQEGDRGENEHRQQREALDPDDIEA